MGKQKFKRLALYEKSLLRNRMTISVLQLCVLCFTLLPFDLVTSLVGVTYAGSDSENSVASVSDSPALPIDPNSGLQRKLWHADISATPEQEDETSKIELRRMMELVQSVTFEPKKENAEPDTIPVKIQPMVPNEPAVIKPAPVKVVKIQKRPEPRKKLPYEPISETTLQMLRDLAKNPEKVKNPFELGETLFLSGNLQEAAVFYTEALSRTEPNDIDPAGNRAWLLFQAGNSLRESDMKAARIMYTQLLTEYPDSTWVQIAKAQVQLIDWYMIDEPKKLIAELERYDGK